MNLMTGRCCIGLDIVSLREAAMMCPSTHTHIYILFLTFSFLAKP